MKGKVRPFVLTERDVKMRWTRLGNLEINWCGHNLPKFYRVRVTHGNGHESVIDYRCRKTATHIYRLQMMAGEDGRVVVMEKVRILEPSVSEPRRVLHKFWKWLCSGEV
jgi:hypothetical protein